MPMAMKEATALRKLQDAYLKRFSYKIEVLGLIDADTLFTYADGRVVTLGDFKTMVHPDLAVTVRDRLHEVGVRV